MSWNRLVKGLVTLWNADTGAGSLDELVTSGIKLVQAADKTALPVTILDLVANEEDDYFDADTKSPTYTWQLMTYIDARPSTAQETKLAIDERIRTVFRRVAPTVDGGYTASQNFYEGVLIDTRQDDTLVLGQQFRTVLTK